MGDYGKKNLKPLKSLIKKFMWKFPSSVVLMFHHVTDMPEYKKSGCLLKTESFHSILNQLNTFISCEDLLYAKQTYFKNKVAITFDDGLADVYSIAYPYLKNRNIPFTIFIVNDFLDTEGYLTTEQLIKMSNDPLITIGAHGVSHKVLSELSSEQKWQEVNESKIRLEQLICKKIKLFAYSHGQYDNECLEMVEKAGYIGAFGVRGFPYNYYSKRWIYHIPRYNVVNESLDKVESMLFPFLHKS